MGAVCQYQQIGSETYFNQETQQYFPISKELKPKSINSSIKHDLKAKYLDIECQFCEKPLMREIASQTKISYNKNQSVKLRKNRSNPQKEIRKARIKQFLKILNKMNNVHQVKLQDLKQTPQMLVLQEKGKRLILRLLTIHSFDQLSKGIKIQPLNFKLNKN